MKRLTLDEWEKAYIFGSVERFDQKNTVERREKWDISIMEQLKGYSSIGDIKEGPGFGLMEWVMRLVKLPYFRNKGCY